MIINKDFFFDVYEFRLEIYWEIIVDFCFV